MKSLTTSRRAGRRGLQHVQPLQQQDVGPVGDRRLPRHDVVGQVRVHRRRHPRPARLHLGDEPQQRPAVVGLREPLARHQPAPLQLRVRPQEPVGGHQRHPRVLRPARQQQLEQPRRRRLPHRHRARRPRSRTACAPAAPRGTSGTPGTAARSPARAASAAATAAGTPRAPRSRSTASPMLRSRASSSAVSGSGTFSPRRAHADRSKSTNGDASACTRHERRT